MDWDADFGDLVITIGVTTAFVIIFSFTIVFMADRMSLSVPEPQSDTKVVVSGQR